MAPLAAHASAGRMPADRTGGTVGAVLRLTGDELVARLRAPHGLDPFGGEPLAAVDLAVDLAVDPAAAAGPPPALGTAPLVAVGVGPGDHPLAPHLDAVVADAAALDALATAVAAHPEAAVALAVLLRGGGGRTVAHGLAAESAVYATLQAGADHRRWLAGRPPTRPPDGRPAGAPVRVRRDGDTVHVTLDRPEVRNAYSAAMRDALVEALAVVAADPDTRAVLDGAGEAFCSGGDLAEFGAAADPAAAHLLRLRRSAALSLAGVAPRVEARVHGACVGAGTELAAFAGRVVARPGTWFQLPELAMGLVPGAGGTVSLPARIGRQRTLLLALTGERLDVDTARAWGLVDDVAP